MDKIQNTDIKTPNVDKDMKQQELSLIVYENENGIFTLENSLALYYKAKHNLTI